MISKILNQLKGKTIVLLGFGREGQSSYRFIRQHFPQQQIIIADSNSNLDIRAFNDPFLIAQTGPTYLDVLSQDAFFIKSPGISLKDREKLPAISSQTDLFLQAFHQQCIGITATKGKSTTASLIYHLIKAEGRDVVFGGNIGIPLFDLLPQINASTWIVLELSSHQLEFISKAPHVALLLNLFEEHLDHYRSYLDYQKAKYNIALCQEKEDFFIYHLQDERIDNLLKIKKPKSVLLGFSAEKRTDSISFVHQNKIVVSTPNRHQELDFLLENTGLKGTHNLLNICAACAALSCLNIDIKTQNINSFKSLPHRLEFVATIGDIQFYNDSISTIPQASIAAVEALQKVDTLILGGKDRGIDYQILVEYFSKANVRNFIFTGLAGQRMMSLFEHQKVKANLFFVSDYAEIVALAKKITAKGKICLLSPAASSYDSFTNFEQRGTVFKNLVLNTKEDK